MKKFWVATLGLLVLAPSLQAGLKLPGEQEADSGPALNPTWPQAVPFADITVQGELRQRLLRNFSRLEAEKYQPQNLFRSIKESSDWPGDYEGRTILGLILEAQAAHRTPKYLEEILRLLPRYLNDRGYFGPVYPAGLAREQQLASHGWVLRALCERHLCTQDEQSMTIIDGILDHLVLPTTGLHRQYPSNPADRENGGSYAGTTVKQIGPWLLSTDTGCDFILLDGLVQAYGVTGREDLKPVIAEMAEAFLKLDLVAIKAQTHASLTALRGVLRYAELTNDAQLLQAVRDRFALYKQTGMSENYENYNWFGRPQWTEPCAVVDSYQLAVGLWRATREPGYLEDAQRIYYNGLAFEQRANGGFGTSSCLGAASPWLSVNNEEAHWCCTMRGAEGLARVAQHSFLMDGSDIVVADFRPAEARLCVLGGTVGLQETTSYPFEGTARFAITSCSLPQPINFRFLAPGWVKDPAVLLNGKTLEAKRIGGFLVVNAPLKRGDKLVYQFDLVAGSEPLSNPNSLPGYRKFFYGPLLLGRLGDEETRLPANALPVRLPDGTFCIEGTNVVLKTVYHLMDPQVKKTPPYKIQTLFQK